MLVICVKFFRHAALNPTEVTVITEIEIADNRIEPVNISDKLSPSMGKELQAINSRILFRRLPNK